MKSINYLNEDKLGKYYIPKEKNIMEEIKIKSKEEIDNFIFNHFFPLLNILIGLGSDINYIENNNLLESVFILLITYPFFKDISLFIEQNNININFQDKSGKTVLMHLINNKERIIHISKDIYNKTFKYFLNNKKIKIEKSDINGISAFGLCLLKGYFYDAKIIYYTFLNYKYQFHGEILIFIVKYIYNRKNYYQIINFFEIFQNNFNNFNDLAKRTLFHYICMYFPCENHYFYIFKEIYLSLIKLNIDISQKDIYDRNPLFYLFIDNNNKIKNNDPIFKLELILKNIKNDDILSQTDIFGNLLIFYAIQAKAYKSINLLINLYDCFTHKNNEGNTIMSTILILKDFNLFFKLYNIKNDNSIFDNKVFSSYQIEYFKKLEKNNVEILYDFYKQIKQFPNTSIFEDEIQKDFQKLSFYNINYNDYNEPKIKSFFLNLINFDILKYLDNYTHANSIKINNSIKENQVINNIIIDKNDYILFTNDIVKEFIKDFENEINKIRNLKSILLAENLFQYCKIKKYLNICKFMLDNNYNIFNYLFLLKDENEIIFYINLYLEKNEISNLIKLTNNKGQTIFHILSNSQYRYSFYKKINLNNINISNIYDNEGNTPIFYACKNLNIIFIEVFSNYSFSSSSYDNDPKKVKYYLFLESKNETNPLKILYSQLDKKELTIFKLIKDISINMKKVYIIYIIKYLIQNYIPINNKIFLGKYERNLESNDYLRKVIGLYIYYTQELKGNIMVKDEEGNDPFFLCIKYNNFEFLFNILLREKNIEFNTVNKEGKSIVHLIIEMNEDSVKKYEMLNKILDEGFDFNIKDNRGLLPIDYAYLNKDKELINILSKRYINYGLSVPINLINTF